LTRRLLPAALLLLASGASGLTAQPAPVAVDRPSPFAAASASMNASVASLRDSIVALARQQIGKRYVLGGASPSRGFDCSGLVQYLAAALKLDVPRTAAEQARAGQAVSKDPSRLRPGDLLTFGTGKRASHIGIYVGDGKFIHASTAAGRVVESRVDRKGRGIKPWRGVRRLLADSDSGTAGGAGG
jgi:cell wall-associated NlpC family hydrolase